jgi:hypothetical protein
MHPHSLKTYTQGILMCSRYATRQSSWFTIPTDCLENTTERVSSCTVFSPIQQNKLKVYTKSVNLNLPLQFYSAQFHILDISSITTVIKSVNLFSVIEEISFHFLWNLIVVIVNWRNLCIRRSISMHMWRAELVALLSFISWQGHGQP